MRRPLHEGPARDPGYLHHARALAKARQRCLEDHSDTALFTAIEAAGAFLVGNPKAHIWKCIAVFVDAGAPGARALVERVRVARNDRMHRGVASERTRSDMVELAVLLEGAFMKHAAKGSALTARDVMTSPVVEAERWQTLYELRRVMLEHGYSVLPWHSQQDGWRFVTAGWLADRLTGEGGGEALHRKLGDEDPKCLPSADTCFAADELRALAGQVLLVLDDCDDVIGIVAPEDQLLYVDAN